MNIVKGSERVSFYFSPEDEEEIKEITTARLPPTQELWRTGRMTIVLDSGRRWRKSMTAWSEEVMEKVETSQKSESL